VKNQRSGHFQSSLTLLVTIGYLHAYFTGADEPYDKLKRALRADIDEAAWSGLYSTVSRPFDKPESGKIAVKVINHYGDEVLKVFEME
jgi:adenine-specific DNA-methyltransferase